MICSSGGVSIGYLLSLETIIQQINRPYIKIDLQIRKNSHSYYLRALFRFDVCSEGRPLSATEQPSDQHTGRGGQCECQEARNDQSQPRKSTDPQEVIQDRVFFDHFRISVYTMQLARAAIDISQTIQPETALVLHQD